MCRDKTEKSPKLMQESELSRTSAAMILFWSQCICSHVLYLNRKHPNSDLSDTLKASCIFQRRARTVSCTQNNSFTKFTFLGIIIFIRSIAYLIFWAITSKVWIQPFGLYLHTIPLICCIMQDGTQFWQCYYISPYILYQTSHCFRFISWKILLLTSF